MKDDCRKWLKNYGDLLRKARKELGVSQLKLARKLGCSQAIISFIECGYMLPPLMFRGRTLCNPWNTHLRSDTE